MAGVEMAMEGQVEDLETILNNASDILKSFSSSVRSLFNEGNQDAAQSLTDGTHEIITKIQDGTRYDAKLFTKVILPLTTKFVSTTNEFFESYQATQFKEWRKISGTLVEKAKRQRQFAETLKKMYEDILGPLKIRQDSAGVVLKKYENLQKQHDAMAREFEASAETKRKWKIGLAFVPVVNLFACPALSYFESENKKKAVAQKTISKPYKDAAENMNEFLMPVLSSFVDCLLRLAAFFQNIELELKSFETEEPEKETEILGHYKLMSRKADKIHLSCKRFYSALPDVRTDVQAIKDGETQQNYIDQWLKKQLAEIKETSSGTHTAIVGVLKGIQGLHICPEFLLPSKPPSKE